MYLKNKFLINMSVSKTTAASTRMTANLVLELLIQECLQGREVVSYLNKLNASKELFQNINMKHFG